LVSRLSGVELLPHQLSTLERAMSQTPIRLAICDEVGLGKTITAGAIFSELKARGDVHRTLIVAPKGVQLQWVAEMADRFSEEFVRVGPEGLPVEAGFDPWSSFAQIVCSVDAVKPIRIRTGWDPERVAEHNRRRFRALVEAGWDLVIIDEAHHVAGSSEEVARHLLARELAAVSPNCLLLSATPHSGKSEGFRRFLGLVDQDFLLLMTAMSALALSQGQCPGQ
jgi:superfamily II DNA or RNA helicase